MVYVLAFLFTCLIITIFLDEKWIDNAFDLLIGDYLEERKEAKKRKRLQEKKRRAAQRRKTEKYIEQTCCVKCKKGDDPFREGGTLVRYNEDRWICEACKAGKSRGRYPLRDPFSGKVWICPRDHQEYREAYKQYSYCSQARRYVNEYLRKK